jgi:uncharacterized protein
LLLLTAFVFLGGVFSQNVDIPPSPERWVTDSAGFLSPSAADELDRRLEAFEQETGRQLIVYIGRTTAGIPIEEWAVKAFEAWRVGRKGLDDGLILIVMADDNRVRIEVGYGLEPVITDYVASRVINDVFIPNVKSGDADRAVRDSVGRLIKTISGEAGTESGPGAEGQDGPRKRPLGFLEKVMIGIAALFFLILLVTNPQLALWLLFTILSGGRGGGGGRGSFRGGGGRSGGGGASGSW